MQVFIEACERPAREVIDALPLPDLSAWELRRAKYLAEARARHDRAIHEDERLGRKRAWLLKERRRLEARLAEVRAALKELP